MGHIFYVPWKSHLTGVYCIDKYLFCRVFLKSLNTLCITDYQGTLKNFKVPWDYIHIFTWPALRKTVWIPRRSLNWKFNCIHADPLFYNFRILKCFDQIKCHNVLILHKILNNKVSESVCETFALMLHSHNTRSINQIIIPQTNTNIFLELIPSSTNVLIYRNTSIKRQGRLLNF